MLHMSTNVRATIHFDFREQFQGLVCVNKFIIQMFGNYQVRLSVWGELENLGHFFQFDSIFENALLFVKAITKIHASIGMPQKLDI